MNPVICKKEILNKKETNKHAISDSNEFYKGAMNPINKTQVNIDQHICYCRWYSTHGLAVSRGERIKKKKKKHSWHHF